MPVSVTIRLARAAMPCSSSSSTRFSLISPGTKFAGHVTPLGRCFQVHRCAAIELRGPSNDVGPSLAEEHGTRFAMRIPLVSYRTFFPNLLIGKK